MGFIHVRNWPTLDLHGYDRTTAAIKTKEFLKDYAPTKWYYVQIIHGVGTGALKEEVHKILKRSKYVDSFKLDMFNAGCTLVVLEGGGELDRMPKLW